MAVVDLLFRQAPLPTTSPVDLLLGETETLADITGQVVGALPPLSGSVQLAHFQDAQIVGALPQLGGIVILGDVTTDAQIVGALPPLSGRIEIHHIIAMQVVGAMPTLGGLVKMNFDVAVDRPTVGQVTTSSQLAAKSIVGIEDKVQKHLTLDASVEDHCDSAIHFETGVEQINPGNLDFVRAQDQSGHAEALRVGTWFLRSSHSETLHDRRTAIRTSSQEGVDVRYGIRTSSQDMYHRRSSIRTDSQDAVKSIHSRRSPHNQAKRLNIYRRTRSQEAMVPPPGTIPVIPPYNPCYTPSADLLFEVRGPSDTALIFYCENHDTPPSGDTVVVPIRSVYIVINNVTLRRVDGDIYLPALSLSLSIDTDSWTWGFSATLPPQSLADVRSSDGTPIELEASINGNLYRLLAEKVSRTRQFGDARIAISGRGKNAILDKPYSPILTFANSIERTAQQLMADVLTFNGIPLGWDVDWQLDDWLVPAGVFNVQGSYIDGLNTIVGAAGAYLQPHPTDQQFRALLRYPVAPWDWSGVTPDFELPSAVTTQEGIEWLVKPDYNRVYVSGQQQGINGRVTRAGTAGDLAAQMVTDPLITEAAAARQRGLSILGDTGRQAIVSLRLPVLDDTGIITPGAFVKYTDGSDEKFGIVRSTSVDCGFPEVWQQISVETHEG